MIEESFEILSGRELYGNDFDLDNIKRWIEDEKEAYADLGASNTASYQYVYHALNCKYGFNLLPEKKFSAVLGMGSAYGNEFKPILGNIENLTIIEPSDTFFGANELKHISVNYVRPTIDSTIPCASDFFDLITCFGVLHHIPNVSKVMVEFFRCIKVGGYVLVREPTISMGDWRKIRPGLTKRERGIPLHIFRKIILDSGFEIVSEKRCMFSLTSRLRYFIKQPVYNSKAALYFDSLLCKLFMWNNIYHPKNFFEKLRPTAVFYVLQKKKL